MKKLEHMTEPELSELMTAFAQEIMAVAAVMEVEKPLFVLLMFNDPKVSQYVSNAGTRRQMIEALREAADRLEHKEDVTR